MAQYISEENKSYIYDYLNKCQGFGLTYTPAMAFIDALETTSSYTWEEPFNNLVWNVQDGNGIKYEKICSYILTRISEERNAYNYMVQLRDFLFETEYTSENIDQQFCFNYFMTPVTYGGSYLNCGACTGVYHNGMALRQLDWYYDNEVEFLVHRPGDAYSYASIGIAAGLPSMVKSFVEAGGYNEKYKLIPFAMTDGVNEKGVFIQSNVVPRKDTDINVTHTSSEYKGQITFNMIPRIVLDNCSCVADVETELSKYDIKRSVRMPSQYDSHLLVADSNGGHGIIEFTQDGTSFNVLSFADGVDAEFLSNFAVDGAGSIAERTFALDWNAVSNKSGHNAGLERWEIAVANILGPNPDLNALRRLLRYTKLYETTTSPIWYTEADGEVEELTPALAKLAHEGDETAISKFENVLSGYRTDYINRSRTAPMDHSTWQTISSVIYDLKNHTANVTIQERFDDVLTFSLNER